MRAAIGLSLVLLVACADPDRDGLPSDFERQIGTEPLLADTDGDGFGDGEEYLDFFLPWDPDDHPYAGGYSRLPLPETVAGEGWGAGDVSLDWAWPDQHAETLRLHRFYGNVVVVAVGRDNCPACLEGAASQQQEYAARRDEGLVLFEVLMTTPNLPDGPDPMAWAQEYGITHPVLPDGDRELADRYLPDVEGSAIPDWTLLDRELRIIDWYVVGEVDWARVDELLEAPLPEVDWPLPDSA